MVIPLERHGGSPPVARQVVEYLRRAIDTGRLGAGTRLPPIRALARDLGVNRETVADAYRQLAALGLAESGVGRGTFVRATTAARETSDGRAPANVTPASVSRTAAAALALPGVGHCGP